MATPVIIATNATVEISVDGRAWDVISHSLDVDRGEQERQAGEVGHVAFTSTSGRVRAMIETACNAATILKEVTYGTNNNGDSND